MKYPELFVDGVLGQSHMTDHVGRTTCQIKSLEIYIGSEMLHQFIRINKRNKIVRKKKFNANECSKWTVIVFQCSTIERKVKCNLRASYIHF